MSFCAKDMSPPLLMYTEQNMLGFVYATLWSKQASLQKYYSVFLSDSCHHPVLPHSSSVVLLIFAPNHRLLLCLPRIPLDPVMERLAAVQQSLKSVILNCFNVRMGLITRLSISLTLTAQGKTGPQCINATHSSY